MTLWIVLAYFAAYFAVGVWWSRRALWYYLEEYRRQYRYLSPPDALDCCALLVFAACFWWLSMFYVAIQRGLNSGRRNALAVPPKRVRMAQQIAERDARIAQLERELQM